MNELKMNLYFITPIINSVFSLGVGILLLTRPRKKIASYLLGGAALASCAMTLCLSASLRSQPETIKIEYLRLALIFASLGIFLIHFFTLRHIRIEVPSFPRLQRVSILFTGIFSVLFVLFSFHPSMLSEMQTIGGKWFITFGAMGKFFLVYVILVILIILYQLEQVYRSSEQILRLRLKFLILGILCGCLYGLFLASVALLYRSIDLDLVVAGAVISPVCWSMIGFAAIRHRLLEVDIFVSRHVVFTSIAAFGVGIYLLGIGTLAYLAQALGGHWDLLVSASFFSLALIVLLLILFSSTLQRRIKRFIHIHFYRYKYDYRLEWNEVTKRISGINDLPRLILKVIELISETLWVHQVSIWLYNNKTGTLSFSMSRNLPRKAEFLKKESPLVQYLLHHSSPLMIRDKAAQKMISEHQDLLSRLQVSMVVPLKSGPRLVGMATLGPIMKGDDYTDEDAELMEVIANQVSGAIIGAQLIEEVGETKEAESFNKISSFLVHDLKNLASSLSLALQNVDRNIAKPEFQKDLVNTLVNTVGKMKTLIEKLSSLPKEMEIRKRPQNLNHLIHEVLETSKVEKIRDLKLVTDLGELPPVKVDGEYIKKVLVNLILNAVQSLPDGRGRVEIVSYAADGYAHVEILDSGVGMTEEFLQKQLFKPFRSTKKKGLGIGLYQCKAIMEAHGGQIKANSIPNRGSQFILKLPVQEK